MPRFFLETVPEPGREVAFTGDDMHHISRSLRMAVGERVTVCDRKGAGYLCELTAFLPDRVCARVIAPLAGNSEPPYRAEVFQALPKGDKLETVIQKAVECGACGIHPFQSARCVARAGSGESAARQQRRDRIALEAAKQSGRGMVPRVWPTADFAGALALAAQADLPLLCYEGEDAEPLPAVLNRFLSGRQGRPAPPGQPLTVSVMVGSEGGFAPEEAAAARAAGLLAVNLGPRILRTETAATFALACLSYALELSPEQQIRQILPKTT